MKILIKNCLSGAKEAEGTAVIIDIFRASNTIIACLAQGASYIIPVGDLEEAYQLKRENPGYLLFGERKGLPPKGFDFNNSPAQAAQMKLSEKSIILTTSAGSQGIVHASSADEIVIGSFANVNALISYLQEKNPDKISLIPIGTEATREAVEDEMCAWYIKARLQGKKLNWEKLKAEILSGEGASRLIRLNQKDDLEFCLQLDTYNIVPKYYPDINRLKIAS